jgi:hypothetical protein
MAAGPGLQMESTSDMCPAPTSSISNLVLRRLRDLCVLFWSFRCKIFLSFKRHKDPIIKSFRNFRVRSVIMAQPLQLMTSRMNYEEPDQMESHTDENIIAESGDARFSRMLSTSTVEYAEAGLYASAVSHQIYPVYHSSLLTIIQALPRAQAPSTLPPSSIIQHASSPVWSLPSPPHLTMTSSLQVLSVPTAAWLRSGSRAASSTCGGHHTAALSSVCSCSTVTKHTRRTLNASSLLQ